MFIFEAAEKTMAEQQHPMMKVDESGNLLAKLRRIWPRSWYLACFSKDGSRLLTVEKVGVAKVFDTETSELVGEIRPVSDLAEATNHRPQKNSKYTSKQ